MGYIFGGNTGLTPDDIKRRREIAAALMEQGSDTSPTTVWGGLGRVASALFGTIADKKASAAQADMDAKTNENFQKVIAAAFGPGYGSSGMSPAGGPPPVMPSDAPPAADRGPLGAGGEARANYSGTGGNKDVATSMARRRLLDAIAGPESAGKYNVAYGGGTFSDMSQHPGIANPITSGPNAGKTSSAAGRYQFLKPTWEAQAAKLGLKDFSPSSQDAAAWDLAATTFKQKTGKDLTEVLLRNDPKEMASIGPALSSQWTSLPGGIEQGIGGNQFAQAVSGSDAQVMPAGGAGDDQLAQQAAGAVMSGQAQVGELLQFLADPNATPAQQRVAAMALERVMQQSDPQTRLELQKLQLEIQKTQKELAGGGEATDPKFLANVRKEVQDLPEVKNYMQAAPIYKSMVDTAGRNSRASDLNLVYGLGKIMDPTSVVREGEMVMVKNTASLPDWLIGTINSLNGGAGLTPETRAAIMREAQSRMDAYTQEVNASRDYYSGIASRQGFNMDDIWRPLPTLPAYAPPEAPAGAAPAGPAPAQEPPAVDPATVPQGVDPEIWKYLTPEEQKAFLGG